MKLKRQRSGHPLLTAVDMQRCESAALDIAEKGSNWWTQFEERGIHVLSTGIGEKPAKCPNMEKPCFAPIITASTTFLPAQTILKTQLLTPPNYNLPVVLNRESFNYYDDEENPYPKTLELFPLKRDDQDSISHTEWKSRFYAANAASMDTEITSKFFEFLLLRN
ncbi:hypothetical protein Lalb_Chr05g0219581 [Lupinus albus]|uniref:Uncharacterized protein n=1 Tax=Lupinus albus TaxID=3870 RepID=A0A6A4QI95_LUPAL|nr:hypothetical protein Lalb_Chr05g0219581 [Lupinus albus]